MFPVIVDVVLPEVPVSVSVSATTFVVTIEFDE